MNEEEYYSFDELQDLVLKYQAKCFNLEQENKQLKENWVSRTKSYNKVVLKNADLEQENKQLKERIDKAIEYIKDIQHGMVFNTGVEVQYLPTTKELLEILGDKE